MDVSLSELRELVMDRKDALEKEMATHSSVLAWRIPGTGEPGGLPSLGSQSRPRLKRLSSSSREAWHAENHGVAKSQTLLSD